MELYINNNKYSVVSIPQLVAIIKQYESVVYKEISLFDDQTSLLVVMNKIHSLCVFFTDVNGGDSMHSFNPDGNNNNYDEFILSNGQRDEYSEDMLIDNEMAYQALYYYLEWGKAYDKITWVPD